MPAPALGGLLLLLASPGTVSAGLVAEQITPATIEERRIGGPDAIGGVGDWYLANDVVEIIVDDPSRAHGKVDHGGTLVDAGRIDRRNEDQLCRLFPILNLSQRVLVNFDTIRGEVNRAEGWARLVVSSRRGPSSLPEAGWLRRWLDPRVPRPGSLEQVRIRTEYRVRRHEPFVHITTTIRNTGRRAAPLFAYGDVLMRGRRGPRAFTGNTLRPERSRGLHHRSFDRRNPARAAEAMRGFTFLSMPGQRGFPPIAYAFFSPERTAGGLPSFFGTTDDQVSLMNGFLFDPDWDRLTLLRMIRAMFEKLPPGRTWTYQRSLLISDRSSVAATTNVLFPLLGVTDRATGIQGRVRPAGVPQSIHVTDVATGAPVTVISPPASGPRAGRYSVLLPPGLYRLSIHAPQRPVETRQMEVVKGRLADALGQLLPEPGVLEAGGSFSGGAPARIVFRGEEGTADPVFDPDLLDFRVDGEPVPGPGTSDALLLAGDARDPRRIAIPPGTYRLTATRGPEFDLASAIVKLQEPGQRVRVPPLRPRRVVELPGFLSADFHTHTQASDDTNTPEILRVRSSIAEGIQVLILTDHNHLSVPDPLLEAMTPRDRIRVIRGVEVTSSAPSPAAPYGIGHTNAWPIHPDPRAHRNGAPPSQNLALADLYARLRRDFGVDVIQMNHPRNRGAGEDGTLSRMQAEGRSYDPASPIDEPPNDQLLRPGEDGRTRAIDFDAIEIMNGPSFAAFLRARRDLYSFLRQGFRRTGTGVSDRHGAAAPALPRSYVRYPPGLEGFDAARFDRAVREGRLFCTTGPLFTRFTVNGGEMGDLVAAPGGRVRVELAVEAAPWVPVAEVRVLVDGVVVRRFDELPPAGSRVSPRLRTTVELVLEHDGFVTLEAGEPLPRDPEAPAGPPGGDYSEVVAPGFVPMAFANPVYVDVDGNRRFDAPGP